MEQQAFLIAAYEITLKERQKAPKGKTASDLSDDTRYLTDINSFLEDFFKYFKQTKEDNETMLAMRLSSSEIIDNIAEHVFEVDYGRNGYPFSVRQNGQNIDYGADDKIVHNYKVIFYEMPNGKTYMVAFRIGHYSCKSAILKSMYSFLGDSNVIPSLDPLTIPESLLDFGDIENIVSLEGDYVETITPNDLSEGAKTQIVKQKFSSINIDLQRKDVKARFLPSLLTKIRDIFTQESRSSICSKVSASTKTEGCVLDPDSLKIVVSIDGKKRTIRLADAESILYYYDVTNKVQKDEKGYADLESVKAVSRDYIKEVDSKWNSSK